MSYNQFSRTPVTNAPKWQDPLSESTLIQGSMLQEQGIQRDRAEFQSGVDAIFGIKAISPADEQVLRKRQQELQESLSDLNVSQLSNPQTKSQINSILTQFKNDP